MVSEGGPLKESLVDEMHPRNNGVVAAPVELR